MPVPDQLTLTDLEALACEVARACGRLIVDERPDDLGVAATKSSVVDIVTEMDRRSESLARRLLTQARPDDALLGEEGLSQPGTSGITWVVDPIDGTVNYLYGVPQYAVSVAAVVGDPAVEGGWRPVAGAVINAASGELFHARIGGGSWREDVFGAVRLQAHPASDLETTLLGTGFSYRAEQREVQGRAIAAILPLVRDIRRMGSAALDLCAVAAGRLDAYAEAGLHPWDLAGGWVIAEEAGVPVHGFDGAHPGARMTFAGTDLVWSALQDHLRVSV